MIFYLWMQTKSGIWLHGGGHPTLAAAERQANAYLGGSHYTASKIIPQGKGETLIRPNTTSDGHNRG